VLVLFYNVTNVYGKFLKKIKLWQFEFLPFKNISAVKSYGQSLRQNKVHGNLNLTRYILRVQPTRCNFSQFIYFCKTLYMFQTGFPSIIWSSKLHIQRPVFVRPILLPAASLSVHHHELKTANTASGICQTITATCC
jgi:hypothetical protein